MTIISKRKTSENPGAILKKPPGSSFIFCMLAAGALGNCIDRFWHHYVVDFIYVSAIDFPVFNVADCYVTIAAVLLIYALIFRYKDDFEKED